MLAEVVTPHESLVAHWTSKALLPGVCSEVASQFIRASKLLATCGPAAGEGALSSVAANVRLQVRALPVGLATPLPRADVRLSPLESQLLRLRFDLLARVRGIGGYEERFNVEPTHLGAGGVRGGRGRGAGGRRTAASVNGRTSEPLWVDGKTGASDGLLVQIGQHLRYQHQRTRRPRRLFIFRGEGRGVGTGHRRKRRRVGQNFGRHFRSK